MLEIVQQLEGKKADERRDIICNLLQERGYDYDVQTFTDKKTKEFGENITVDIGEGKDTLLICSHYDIEEDTWGANHNASANACMLGLLDELWEMGPQMKLRFLFFDKCLSGNKGLTYFLKNNTDNIKAAINLEMVGFGDNYAIWPIGEEEFESIFIFEQQAKERGHYCERLPQLLPNDTNALFKKAKIDTFNITSMTSQDIINAREAMKVWDPKLNLMEIMRESPIFLNHNSMYDTTRFLSQEDLESLRDILVDTILELSKPTI